MARRTSRTPTRTRQPKATSKKKVAPSTHVDVVKEAEEADDGNVDSGIVIMTTILMVAAILLVDALRGGYGEGLFF